MKKCHVRKRARGREIEDDETIDEILETHYKKPSFSIKKPFKLNPKHQELLQLIQDEKTNMVFVNGPAGTAKAQPLDSPILTPNGWVEMGDISVNDYVFTATGKSAKVIGVFPQGKKHIVRINFSDGTNTECCEDHLWYTHTYNDRYNKRSGCVKTTKEIRDTITVTENNTAANHSIPITQPVQFDKKELVIDPYVLGVLLGDGCFRQQLVLSSADEEIITETAKRLPGTYKITHRNNFEYVIKQKEKTNKSIIKEELCLLELWGKLSHEKFIPNVYLFSSIQDRIDILRGLMDTDGTVFDHNITFCSTSKQLANDVRYLVESLGGIATINETTNSYTYKSNKKHGKNSFRVTLNIPINPFYLKRKAEKVKTRTKYHPMRYIKSIEDIGEKFCQCIMIEDDSHLYLTNNCIVTHNTYVAVYGALELLRQEKVEEIVYIRSIIESASRSIGALPGEIDDKFQPYTMPLVDKLREIVHIDQVPGLFENGFIRTVPVNFTRGLTFNKACVIIDEAQNLTRKELVTILTRFGNRSTYIVCGDSRQNDIKDTGFKDIMKAFDTPKSQSHNICCLEFGRDEIVRSAILKHIVDVIGD